jgi:hypothetical protein
MAQPMYNTAVDIPTNADTTGKWKALYNNDAAGKKVKVDMCGSGTELTFYMPAYSLLPCHVCKVYTTGTDVTNGKLTGLN